MHDTITVKDLILRDLNSEQQRAVTTTQGPVLIIAGAGSGKTRVIVHRMAYLMAETGVPASQILAVTFTNKAAQNMRQRMSELINDDSIALPMMGTFHALSAYILRQEAQQIGLNKNFTIFDSDDQRNVVKKILKELGHDTKQIAPAAIHNKISAAKNLMQTPEQLASQATDFYDEIAAAVYPRYQELLAQQNAVDFDDLIMKTVLLWQDQPAIVAKYQAQWRYVLVDEYQDTNQAQYQWIRLLTATNNNICVVGDDAQSIYSWRMADIRNILDFEKDFPDATVIVLEQNYRSTQTILNAANHVIAKNKKQKKKKLWTTNDSGTPITVAEVTDADAEGRYIVETLFGITPSQTNRLMGGDEISYDTSEADVDWEETAIQPGQSILQRVMQQQFGGQKYQDDELRQHVRRKRNEVDCSGTVVLYRTNAQSRTIEEACMRFGVPYTVIGGLRFYERREIKDAVAWLRAVLNPGDWVALERIVNLPPRGIGARSWFHVEQFGITHNYNLLEAGRHAIPNLRNPQAIAVQEFANLLNNLQTYLEGTNARSAYEQIIVQCGYKDYIKQYSQTQTEGQQRQENIDELGAALERYSHLPAREGLQAFLQDIALMSDQDEVENQSNSIRLMTVHAAKGLEFPQVFVVGMEEGLFPHIRAINNPTELAEERRLCYVAMTRAQYKLHFVYANQRQQYGRIQVNRPSRFLSDIPKDLLHWQ